MLTCGVVGLPMSGKTTLFHLLTDSKVESNKPAANTATAWVPDSRVDYLSSIFRPAKTTYAQVMLSDLPGLVSESDGGHGYNNRFLSAIRGVDAILVVVRAFRDEAVGCFAGSIDPTADLSTIESELILADLQLVEARLERLLSSRKLAPEQRAEIPVLEKVRDGFMDQLWLTDQSLTVEEKQVLRGYGLLTAKPMVLVINLDEAQLASHQYEGRDELKRYAERRQCESVELSCKVESEIMALDEPDRHEFMEEYGIEEPGISKVARSVYASLSLISFFTVGKDEVRAWTVTRGTNAKRAARAIHSDIERGFIRAEVVSFEDFRKAGSIAAARAQGTLRLEGKDYEVQDGDIIEFRFNV